MEGCSSSMPKKEPVELLKEPWFSSSDWFSSLSDSELDLLISLKELVISRAKSKGCEEYVQRISLDTLRGLGVILLEDLKERMRTKSIFQTSHEGTNPLDKLELMKSDNERRSKGTIYSDSKSLDFSTPKRKDATNMDHEKLKKRKLEQE